MSMFYFISMLAAKTQGTHLVPILTKWQVVLFFVYELPC